MYLNDTSTRNLREIARALLREIESQGHICVHAEDWGSIKADMATVKREVAGDGKDIKSLREEMAGLRAERRIAAAVVGFLGAVLGGLITAFAGRS
jgi:hypothetical protein